MAKKKSKGKSIIKGLSNFGKGGRSKRLKSLFIPSKLPRY